LQYSARYSNEKLFNYIVAFQYVWVLEFGQCLYLAIQHFPAAGETCGKEYSCLECHNRKRNRSGSIRDLVNCFLANVLKVTVLRNIVSVFKTGRNAMLSVVVLTAVTAKL
jgi:hypothetical protein